MTYDFSTLSPADFEDLARDLVGADIGKRLEGFGPGPDGGVDGRHASGKGGLVLQAKHKTGSPFTSLKAVMKKERRSIDRLKPSRYILATSQSLTPGRKDKLAQLIGPTLKDTGDILGRTELNAILRQHPNVERAHIKLWLSSTTVLDRFLRSAAFAYTATTRQEMMDKLRVYAPNPSFAAARDVVEKHHVLIVSGAPGVGKTTLAQMLVYAYVGEEWEFVAIRSLDDGFAAIQDTKKQVFFFDDFLGKIALDRRALATKDSDLARFIFRVQRSKNARFILTTRAYIYEEARRVSESLGDRRLQITKYVLDVGVYTRRVRARILYNHLVASNLPSDYAMGLVTGNALPTIIDHENYNPRVMEWMTDAVLVKDISPDSYADRFIEALDHPTEIWDRAFREHIPPKGRHLLISLFFCSEYGEGLDDLRIAFESTHMRLCEKYHLPSDPTDFQESLKILEGSFLSIRDRRVFFVNPSVRDYLHTHLADPHLLADLAPMSRSATWAQAIWRYFKSLESQNSISRSVFAALFTDVADQFKDIPAWRSGSDGPQVLRSNDLSLTDRIELLMEWHEATDSARFADALYLLVCDPPGQFSCLRDGDQLPRLIEEFRCELNDSFPRASAIADRLEPHLIEILQDGISSDDLENIREAIDGRSDVFSEEVFDTLLNEIKYQIDEAPWLIRDFDSETELDDHAETLQNLAAWAGLNPSSALSSIEQRLEEVRAQDMAWEAPSFPSGRSRERDNFDDEALRSLFETLANT